MKTQKKKIACISMSADIYHKLNSISTIERFFFDRKEMTMSHIVDIALEEYFKNHIDEITETLHEYHEKGGCIKL